MKKIITICAILLSSFAAKAQWSGGTDLTSPTTRSGSVSLTSVTSTLSLGNGIYFYQSGNASDGLPYARFNENYGIRFGSPNSTWVLSTKTSFLAGFQPAGEDWGTGNIYASNKIAIGTNLLPQQLTLTGGIGFANFNAWDKKLYASNDGVLEWMTHDAATEHGFTISHQGQRRVFLNTNGNSYFNGGYVGIGTTSPSYKLTLAGGDIKAYNFDNNSGITIGAENSERPRIGFHVSDNNRRFKIEFNDVNQPLERLGFFTNNGGAWPETEVFSIGRTGNVGIGNINPDAKLAVKGQIHAQEVKVDLNGAVAPDYVFEKDYKLTSLEEIKNYIDQNKHLPDVPSAKEMERNGVQLGEMNMLLLKKIEELTLHMIELKRENEEQRIQNLTQQKQIDELKTSTHKK